jgi:hypothetical protein
MRRAATVLLACVGVSSACGSDGPDHRVPFADDYASSYVEVRDCRRSGDHNLNFIRVVAPPDIAAVYQGRTDPFPDGAVVLKEEYDFADDTCAGPVTRWTAMVRDESASDTLGWTWYDVAADRRVVSLDQPSCYGCHSACVAPAGYLGTCSEP